MLGNYSSNRSVRFKKQKIQQNPPKSPDPNSELEANGDKETPDGGELWLQSWP